MCNDSGECWGDEGGTGFFRGRKGISACARHLFGGICRLTTNDGRAAADKAERILVEDACEGFIELRQLVTELDGAFEEDLNSDRPEFVIVRCRVIAKQVSDAGLLHRSEDRPGYFGEIGEFLLKMTIFFGLSDVIDI